MELETPDPVTIPLDGEAIIPVQWQPHPTGRVPSGLVEPLVGQPVQDLVMGPTLVNTMGSVLAVRVINLCTEPHTMKVAGCNPVTNSVEVRDENIHLDRPQRESREINRNWLDSICEICSSVDFEAQREGLHNLINHPFNIFFFILRGHWTPGPGKTSDKHRCGLVYSSACLTVLLEQEEGS